MVTPNFEHQLMAWQEGQVWRLWSWCISRWQGRSFKSMATPKLEYYQKAGWEGQIYGDSGLGILADGRVGGSSLRRLESLGCLIKVDYWY